MKRSGATLIRVIWQAFRSAIGGAFTGTILALIADPESVLNFTSGGPPGPVLQFVMWGAIGGAAYGGVLSLGKDSLWMGIANINTGIIFMSFVGAILALQIEFYEVGWLMPIIMIAGYLMALLTSLLVTRPLQLLAEATQSIGEQDLSEWLPVKGSREIRTMAQSFNEMAEALQTAETRRKQLLADVAHELRTPLTVLQSNLRAILDDVVDPDKAQMFTLYSQTRQLNHLVDDLHDLAQADAQQLLLDKTEIDLIALIEQAGELFAPLAQEDKITLHLATPEQMPVLLGDRNRLIQVLQNLLANGLRHADSRVDLRLWQDGETACVVVVDDGDGIAAEHLPHIFDRFYRTDPSRSREMGGSGLGLAIAQAIVEAHGGTITATSNGLGQGTILRFELPLLQIPNEDIP